MAGTIQSSINQAIGSLGVTTGLRKFLKGQQAIVENQNKLNDLIKEAAPVYEGHELGYEQGIEDIQSLYDPQTGKLNENVISDVLTNPIYKDTTGRAAAEAIVKSRENLTSNQIMTSFQNMNLKERAEFLKQGQHYQSQQKREEQQKKYEEGKL